MTLLEEGLKVTSASKEVFCIDRVLVSVLQKMGHHDVASYRSLRDWAEFLGCGEVADALEEMLDERVITGAALNGLERALALHGEPAVISSPLRDHDELGSTLDAPEVTR